MRGMWGAQGRGACGRHRPTATAAAVLGRRGLMAAPVNGLIGWWERPGFTMARVPRSGWGLGCVGSCATARPPAVGVLRPFFAIPFSCENHEQWALHV